MPVPVRRTARFFCLSLSFVMAVVVLFFLTNGGRPSNGAVAQGATQLQLRYLHTGLVTINPNTEFSTTATCLDDETINTGGFVIRSYNRLLPPVVLQSRPEESGGLLDSWEVTIFNPDPKAAVTFQVYATCWATTAVGTYDN
jgi:hypothetical protein